MIRMRLLRDWHNKRAGGEIEVQPNVAFMLSAYEIAEIIEAPRVRKKAGRKKRSTYQQPTQGD